jgi:hypothetical protein
MISEQAGECALMNARRQITLEGIQPVEATGDERVGCCGAELGPGLNHRDPLRHPM